MTARKRTTFLLTRRVWVRPVLVAFVALPEKLGQAHSTGSAIRVNPTSQRLGSSPLLFYFRCIRYMDRRWSAQLSADALRSMLIGYGIQRCGQRLNFRCFLMARKRYRSRGGSENSSDSTTTADTETAAAVQAAARTAIPVTREIVIPATRLPATLATEIRATPAAETQRAVALGATEAVVEDLGIPAIVAATEAAEVAAAIVAAAAAEVAATVVETIAIDVGEITIVVAEAEGTIPVATVMLNLSNLMMQS